MDAADLVTRVLTTPGGAVLVVDALGRIPGATVVPGRSGRFRSAPTRVQLGAWRYESGAGGRLTAAHVVGGIVIGEEVLGAGAGGPHVARAVTAYVADVGPQLQPEVDAVLEGLRRASE